MKKSIITIMAALLVSAAYCQSGNTIYSNVPAEFSYSAIAYNAQGQPLQLQTITLRTSILSVSNSGPVEYREVHTVITRDDGSFEIRIGTGTPSGGNYSAMDEIDWGANEYFLKIEIDAAGGNNFGDAATEKFCSVPYAFRSAVTDSIKGISMDTLRIMVDGTGGCNCDLQQAYDNGKTILVNNVQQEILFRGNVNSSTPI